MWGGACAARGVRAAPRRRDGARGPQHLAPPVQGGPRVPAGVSPCNSAYHRLKNSVHMRKSGPDCGPSLRAKLLRTFDGVVTSIGSGPDRVNLKTRGGLVLTPGSRVRRTISFSMLGPTPYTLHPSHCTLHHTLHPALDTLHPTPDTLHPKLEIRQKKSLTLNPKPHTRNPKPQTPNPNLIL